MRGRGNPRKGPNPLSKSYESNGPDIKIRGTAQHITEKYMQLARDAQVASDPVKAENYFQHAEHYFRIIATAQEQYRQQFGDEESDDNEGEGFSNSQDESEESQSQPFEHRPMPQTYDNRQERPHRHESNRQDQRHQDGRYQEPRQDGRSDHRRERFERPQPSDRLEARPEHRNDHRRDRFRSERPDYRRDEQGARYERHEQGAREQGTREQGARQDQPRSEPHQRDSASRERDGRDNAPRDYVPRHERFPRRRPDEGQERFSRDRGSEPAPLNDEAQPALPAFLTNPVRPVAQPAEASADNFIQKNEAVVEGESEEAVKPRRRAPRRAVSKVDPLLSPLNDPAAE
jgi:hypothetical protein